VTILELVQMFVVTILEPVQMFVVTVLELVTILELVQMFVVTVLELVQMFLPVRCSRVIFIAARFPEHFHAILILSTSGRSQGIFKLSNSLPKLRETRNKSIFILYDVKLTSSFISGYCSNNRRRSMFGNLNAVKCVTERRMGFNCPTERQHQNLIGQASD
jgi:hypothetical protein